LKVFVADVLPHITTDMTSEPMNLALNAALVKINTSLTENRKVKKSEHRAFAYSSVIPLFLNSHPFLFIYAINLPKLGLLFSPKSISGIKDKIQLFDEELKYLTKNEKKALFIYVQDIVNNFDALAQEYTEVTLEKKYLKPQSVSDEKDVLEALLNRIKMSLNNTASKRTAIYPLVPAAAIYEIADSLRAHGITQIKGNIRSALLAELLDENNPLKAFLLGHKIASAEDLDGYLDEPDYDNRLNENILKQSWNYLHLRHSTSSDVMHNIYPSDPDAVDAEIRILQEGKKIVENNVRIIDGPQYSKSKSAIVISDIDSHIGEIEIMIKLFMDDAGIVDPLLLPEPFKTYCELMNSTRDELAAKTKVAGGQKYLWQCDARKFVDISSQDMIPIKDILQNPQKLISKLMKKIGTVREALGKPNKLPQGSYNPLQAASYNITLDDAEGVLKNLVAPTLIDLPIIFGQKEAIEKLLKKFGLN
jgi:hypothetical protein